MSFAHLFHKHLILLKRILIINFRRFSEYKINYYIRLTSFLGMTAFMILFWKIILLKTDSIQGWEMYSLALMVVYGRFQGTFFYGIFGGMKRMADYIVEGKLTNVMIRPNNIFIRIMFNEFHMLGILDLILALTLTFIVIFYFGSFTFLKLLLSLGVLLIGNIIIELIFGCVSLLAFWFGRIDLIVEQMEGLLSYARYPLNIFPRPVELIFTFLIPMIFLRTYPVMIYTGNFDVNIFYVLISELILLVIWIIIFSMIWKKGFERYESFGG